MYTVSHAALFYLFGKAVNVKKLWSGLVGSVLPDIALILFWLGAMLELDISFASSDPVNLFLHSVFPILFMIPLALVNRWYFYSTALGYSFHLLLDYMTHTAIRMPLYPLSTWKLPIFVVSYFDPTFIMVVKVTICAVLLLFFGKPVFMLIRKLFDTYNCARVWCILVWYILIISFFTVWYTSVVVNVDAVWHGLLMPVIGINIFILGILFMQALGWDIRLDKLLNILDPKR